MRYFYRVGEYKHERPFSEEMKSLISSLGYDDMLTLGKKIDLMNSYKALIPEVPEEYNCNGHDIRDWTQDNIFIEVKESLYNNIVKDEEWILKDKKTIHAGIRVWHQPIKTEIEDIETFFLGMVEGYEVHVITLEQDVRKEIRRIKKERKDARERRGLDFELEN